MESNVTPPPKRRRQLGSKKKLSGAGSKRSDGVSIIILSEDIMISILNRLPLKSLMRLKSVCKTWHHLIADAHRPDSCYSFLSRCRRFVLGFFTKLNGPQLLDHSSWIPYYDDDHHHHHLLPATTTTSQTETQADMDVARNACLWLWGRRHCHVLASSKQGILLCTSGRYNPEVYTVFNPLTRQKVNLPKLKFGESHYRTLGFDCWAVTGPSGIPTLHYVVMLVGNRFTNVFSSNQLTWKKLHLCRPSRNRDLNDGCRPSINTSYVTKGGTLEKCMPAVVIRDVCYWMECKRGPILASNPREGSGHCWEIQLPADVRQEFDIRDHLRYPNNNTTITCLVGTSDDRLYCGAAFDKEEEIGVWVYNNNNGTNSCSWELKHRKNLMELLKTHPETSDEAICRRGAFYNEGINFSFQGFHPCDPGIVFLIYKGRFLSYSLEREDLKVYARLSHQVRIRLEGLIPFQWSPWPHLLSQPK